MMKNIIKCKKCGEEIEISEALTHQIQEQVITSPEIKHRQDIEETKKLAEESSQRKASKEFESKIVSLDKEKEEEKVRNTILTEQLNALLEETRLLRRKDEERN